MNSCLFFDPAAMCKGLLLNLPSIMLCLCSDLIPILLRLFAKSLSIFLGL
jgi:hypothetical protein